jgi:hypothetical protein
MNFILCYNTVRENPRRVHDLYGKTDTRTEYRTLFPYATREEDQIIFKVKLRAE